MTWARSGCTVLVIDHLGHGERRQHPFRSEKDYPKPFRVGRQDYYFRYDHGPAVAPRGREPDGLDGLGPDARARPAAVATGDRQGPHHPAGRGRGGRRPGRGHGARSIPAWRPSAPFNFGGPQPDFAIPADAERDFYYFGVPEWESTRCLRLGARDGFAHWLIVGAVAPRRLIYAHEFAWDAGRDPVWPRLQKIFGWYGAPDHLAVATGRGQPQGHAPGKLALQQHRTVAPQPDLSRPGAMVRHADPRGIQPEADDGRAALPDTGGRQGIRAAAAARAVERPGSRTSGRRAAAIRIPAAG